MDNKRIAIWGALGALIWLNVITWQHDYPGAPEVTSATNSPPALTSTVPAPTPNSSSTSSVGAPIAAAAAPPPAQSGSKIHVATDVLDVDLNTRGGDVERVDLLKYALNKDQPNTPVRLLDDRTDSFFAIHSGLSSVNQFSAPSHLAVFSTDASSYRLPDGNDDLMVDLKWNDGQGVNITKSFVFHRGSYAIEVRYTINNATSTPWKAASYIELYRHDIPIKRSMFNAETISYRGPAIYDGSKYQKLDLTSDKYRNYQNSFASGWMAALQHHFVVAVIPSAGTTYDYSLKQDAQSDFSLTARGSVLSVDPGKSASFSEKIFVGPKLQNQLIHAGPELQRTTDFNTLYIIAQPLFELLQFIHKATGNWGVDIILVTLLIKLAFYWLTASSGRSMAKMRMVAPKMKALQERYKDDREQLGRATMELYRKEKVNPIAGCLPMLIQMPFLMGFYWVLLESAEMHQAPFFGWITDLSARDPFFILPVVMGIANFVQFKVNPPQADPTQAKIMAFMPIVMTGMMAWFPSGLLLYWITNTIVSALQQWRINKLVEADNQNRKT